ncbi:hypothetical protein PVAND_001604 [Polypedilum vanderplanki]|uniref:Zinc finger protein-like 1 homolog n=1 Tax=Polypedilum vanderplanki TaxID=319348 RepID=A0A9J6BPQ6_POLVA|nr:hypothetical protein PVAND_001604 [Polypedilum vanderplanki]
MGLCKCPKKTVSNLFCFDHRVTVCESCLVINHRKCVIQSYLQWLKDSDYDSTCSLCGIDLESEDCIRLVCYDLFHKKCLEQRQLKLPATTAAAGHTCPKCQQSIFPPPNLVSPIADTLRIWLSEVSWGRNEIAAFNEEKEYVSKPTHETLVSNGATTSNFSPMTNSNLQIAQQHHRNVPEKVFRPESPHSILNIESRPLLREVPIGRSSDRDDNKYKRKTPQEIFSRWSRQFYSPASKPPWKKTWFIIMSGFLTFFMIIYLMYHFGRAGSSHDLDNIHYDE